MRARPAALYRSRRLCNLPWQVDEVHVDPRVREQEFGNFLDLESYKLDNAWAELVGRFYYRRDNGESSADV